MKCKNCGRKNKDNAVYCISCGEPLSGGGGKRSNKGNNKLIILLLVIIIILIATVGFFIINNDSSNIQNNTIVNNTSSTVENESVETNDTVEDNEIEKQNISTISQTIIEEDTDYIQIYGVSFTVPAGGSYRTSCAYQFKFNGQDCEVEEVEHYESSDSQRTIKPLEFSKYYPGGEGYVLYVNNHVWKGIKVEKDNKWFHISMKTNDDDEVLKLLDWMYEKNTWVGH